MARHRLYRLAIPILVVLLTVPFGAPASAQDDAQAFLDAVAEQTSAWDASYAEFSGYRARLAEGPADTEGYMLLTAMDEEATSWAAYSDALSELAAPEGCESAGEALTSWGGDVEELADAWKPLSRRETEQRWQDFDDQVAVVEASRAELDAALDECGSTAGIVVTDTDATPSSATPDAGGDSWGSAATRANSPRTGTSHETGQGTIEIEGDTYVLPTSGAEVVIGPGITLDDAPEGDVPDQLVFETNIGIGAVGAFEGSGNSQAILALYVRGFGESMDSVTEISLEGSGGLSTGVYRVESSGVSMLMFIRVDAESIPGYQLVEVLITPVNYFERELSVVQTSISVNGVPLLAGVDGAEIVDLYESAEP